MAKKALVLKSQKTPKYPTRGYHRCQVCGRARAYYRLFGLCRIHVREFALKGQLPGMKKSSW